MNERQNCQQVNQPEITVIVPCYNVARYVKRAIHSVLAQTLKNIEIIAIDDGSGDGTYQELLSISDERFQVYRHSCNQGVSAALNIGISLAKGKYMAALGADDRWFPDKLEKQISYLKKYELDIVGCWTIEEFEGNYAPSGTELKQIENRFDLKGSAFNFFLTALNVGVGSTLLGKREFIDERLDEKLRTNEDWEYFARLAIAGFKFGIIPMSLVICARRADGLSKTESNADLAITAICKFKHQVSDYILAQSYIRSALWMTNPENPKISDARILIGKAVQSHPGIIFSRNFIFIVKFFVINYFQRIAIVEKKYS